jgi:hypothetical protein
VVKNVKKQACFPLQEITKNKLTTKPENMKRIALLFVLLFTMSSGFISCRDTEREADDVEEVGEEIEEAGDELEDELD